MRAITLCRAGSSWGADGKEEVGSYLARTHCWMSSAEVAVHRTDSAVCQLGAGLAARVGGREGLEWFLLLQKLPCAHFLSKQNEISLKILNSSATKVLFCIQPHVLPHLYFVSRVENQINILRLRLLTPYLPRGAQSIAGDSSGSGKGTAQPRSSVFSQGAWRKASFTALCLHSSGLGIVNTLRKCFHPSQRNEKMYLLRKNKLVFSVTEENCKLGKDVIVLLSGHIGEVNSSLYRAGP